jgi:hypothetical protein
MDAHADIGAIGQHRLGGVQAHPHPHRRALGPGMRRERQLAIDRRAQRVVRRGERYETRVAVRVDLVAVASGARLAQDAPVLGQDLGVPVAETA